MSAPTAAELVSGEYFPAFDHVGSLPVVYPSSAALMPLSPGDLDLGWHLDFHYPTGTYPLSHVLVGALFRAAAAAADGLPSAVSHGLSGRTVGPHVYSAAVEIHDAEQQAERAASATTSLLGYAETFRELWRQQTAELDRRFSEVMAAATGTVAPEHVDFAVELAVRGWRIHFDIMYRLLAIDASFETLCRALGVTPAESAALRSAGRSSIADADQAMAALAASVAANGLTDVFARTDPGDLLAALRSHSGATTWLAHFDDFIDVTGDRSEVVLDVAGPSWRDDPSRPLAVIQQWVLGSTPAPDTSARVAGRDEVLARVRARLAPGHRRAFDTGHAAVDAANFSWWNEDHNAVIDLRLHLALRALGRTVVVAAGGDAADAPYLFAEEVRALAAKRLAWSDVADLASQRRHWRAKWQSRRPGLPRVLGSTAPPLDPVMAHIIGGLPGDQGAAGALVLFGLAASPGRHRGRVRVVRTPDELVRLEPGEVLVCEATSPSWTPAFATAGACVCDSGGVLTHAAIICREYGLPCVCAVGVATSALRDGELVEVDGTAGTVTRLGGG